MNYHEIVKKLIGPIYPMGETEEDMRRFENLENTIELAHILTDRILSIRTNYGDRKEASIKKLVKLADQYYSDLWEMTH